MTHCPRARILSILQVNERSKVESNMAGFVAPEAPIAPNAFVAPEAPITPDPSTNSFEFERSPNYPTAAMTDVTPQDLLTVQGVGGLAKAGAGALGETAAAEGGGLLDTMGQYAKRFGQNQVMKTLGARSGQIGQVGIPES